MTNEMYKNLKLGINFEIFPQFKWDNRTIHYVISPLYQPSDLLTIKMAIRKLNELSCLKFKPYDGKAKDFLLIWPVKHPQGCYSYIGKVGGMQILSLQAADRDGGQSCLGKKNA
jgi:Astacin (Peptidase family M12A)